MTSPSPESIWSCFESIAPDSYFEQLIEQHQLRCRRRIYWLGVVVWLMIYQRLQGDASLAAAVMALWPGQRRKSQPICSAATGAYCQARQRLPTLVASQVSDHIFTALRARAALPSAQEAPVFVIDGSTLRLEHEPDLLQAYAPGRNRHGENHWPVLQLVVFHDAHTGLAVRPSFGPMYGPKRVSEQQLAEEALDRLPAEAIVLADRNFGVFAFAYAVAHSKRRLVLRLTDSRARKIWGEALPAEADRRAVTWKASRWDRQAHPALPKDAQIPGWVVACPPLPGGTSQTKIYLFTTLDQSPAELLQLYQLRWNVETDLRSLKRTVGLHHLHSRDAAMVEKELVLAVAAYNLIRAVMLLAAERSQVAPRQLSFANVQALLVAALPGLQQANSQAEQEELLEQLLEMAAKLRLSRRKRKRPTYPRAVWSRGSSFLSRYTIARKACPS